ncbi:chloramphenicol phosphotransferase CPT family protein [Lentzea sp. JNUCC 0626]|uniref:chloramphenicol phosphotransferase CPT family protein n=1 Tax=Lentzea sp. JNUCC 0626 TaxID=3367513 RepID=UPI003749FB3C
MTNQERNGRVVFLNGTSSSGKTTLARSIQDRANRPHLHWGIDGLFAMVPPRWGGGLDGPLSREGFWYDRTGHDERGPLAVIRYGPAGARMLAAGCRAAAELVRGGNDLIIDEMLLAPELAPLWLDALRGLDVLFVHVTCPLPLLEERERARNNPAGLARGHLATTGEAPFDYGLVVDTSTASPEELADTVLNLG